MKLLSTLSLLICTVAAQPLLSARQDNSTFRLKTAGSDNPEHNNLYVFGFHTGAGFNDAVLTPSVDTASKAFLNGTQVQFQYGTTFPWGLQPVGNTNYAAWEPVEINVGYGQSGFFFNSTGLQWSEQFGFGGWLVCDWYHNAPQLFYVYRYEVAHYPASCSEVNVLPEPVA
ncbi:hypothetical protein P175DRAFT_0502430 [Aspergillus ochraceoroseus IBT 24754]|uniref:DUF7907 domain-containing protein n=2 Tax=Aspergillus ochraceoroseus TaxID=138278 RepID=A0A2T5LVF9_9EURO|nr:uncharacterized protein P175DRAFT_0502430 [Aspergillus ochraceoroseus IBT 24754]KKK18533.1 hypothetical protein AOCH_000757 [Aspergillus ochraceoroseus]PTU20278.1 hypothetical protein P175DRAFT_0502430 [Aspergillus ochraceoroseus IBT 24754]